MDHHFPNTHQIEARSMRCIDLEQFNAEKDVPSMGVHAQIYPARESEVKVRSVYLIYQRLARKVADDELHGD